MKKLAHFCGIMLAATFLCFSHVTIVMDIQ